MASTHWTPEDLRKNARNWSLEGDSELLELMKSISDNLLKRANTTANNVNNIGITLEKTSIAFENASNKLSALSKTQFVENRVYDEDEIRSKRELKTEKRGKFYNPNETIKIILQNNLKMLENCYEKVSVDLDDSDEEGDETKRTIIYRPQNLYVNRLPSLIGSSEWTEKWHIGLFDSDEESISEKGGILEEFSDDSVEVVSLPSVGPTISESGSSIWSINRNLHLAPNSKKVINLDQSSDYEVISSNTFTSKTSSEKTKKLKLQKRVMQSDEQKYYIHKPKIQEYVESSDSAEENAEKMGPKPLPRQFVSSFSQKENQGLLNISNVFSDEPPDIDSDENSRKSVKNYGIAEKNLKQNRIVEDENKSPIINENDLTQNEKINRVMKKTINLFDDHDFDSFMKELNQKTSNNAVQKNISKKVNLFNSDSENESSSIRTSESSAIISSKKNGTSDFNREIKSKSNNEHFEKNNDKNNSFSFNNEPRNFFDEVDGEHNLFSPIKSKYKNVEFLNSSKTRISNLFDDDPPDDEFDSLFKTSIPKQFNSSSETSNNKFLKNISEENSHKNISKINKNNLLDLKNKFSNSLDSTTADNISTQVINCSNEKPALHRENLSSSLLSIDWPDEKNLLSTKNAQKIEINLESDQRKLTNNVEKFIKKQSNVNDEKFSNEVNTKFYSNFSSIDSEVSSSSKSTVLDIENLFKESTENSVKPKINFYENDKVTKEKKDKQLLNEKILEEQLKDSNSALLPIAVNKDMKEIEYSTKQEIIKTGNIDRIKGNIPPNQLFNVPKSFTEHEEIQIKIENQKLNYNTSEISAENEKTEKKKDLSLKYIENHNFSEKITDHFDKGKIENDLCSLLFSNTPPDDEGIFVKAEKTGIAIREPLLETSKKLMKYTNNLNSYGNNHIGLFDDMPPDDVIVDVKKHSDSIYNEDYESTPKNIYDKDMLLNYVINDEPPPDDYFKENTDQSNEVTDLVNKQFTNKTIISKVNQNLIALKSENINNLIETKDSKCTNNQILDECKIESKLFVNSVICHDQILNSAKHNSSDFENHIENPKKLKQNLILNVNALVAGGKVSDAKNKLKEINSVSKTLHESNVSKRKKHATDFENTSNTNQQNEDNNDVNKYESTNNVTKEGKLIGLNKSRAKILFKRRPSTRKARQESYRKSKLENENTSEEEEQYGATTTKENSKMQNENANEFTKNISFSKDIKNLGVKDTFLNIQTNVLNNSNKNSFKEKDNSLKIKENLKSKISLFSSNDSDSENSDLFAEAFMKTKTSSHINIKNKRSSSDTIDKVFNSKSIFKEPEVNMADEEIFDNLQPNTNNSESISKNHFQQKVPETNVNDKNLNIKTTSEFIPTLKYTNNSKSFLEDLNNDDDDDLFSSPFVKVIATQIPNTIFPIEKLNPQYENKICGEDNDKIFKKVKIKKRLESLNSTEQHNISHAIAIVSTKSNENKSKGLFSSDEDDELLFGDHGSRTPDINNKKQIHSKKIETNIGKFETVKNLNKFKQRGTLFDDTGDDEDDDLFGNNKTLKVTTSKIINHIQPSRGAIPKRPLEKKATKVQDSSNPLADLLGK